MAEFLTNLDYSVFKLINSELINPFFDIFFVWITDLHKTAVFKFTVIPLVAFLFIRKFKREGVTLFLILILSLSVNDFVGGQVKNIIERPRPEFNTSIAVIKRSEAGSFSFYSNHASNMFTFATFTSQFIPQIKIPLFIVAVLVSYSRVYNGVHYPSDILTGALIGCLWGFFMASRSKKLLHYLKQRKKAP